MVSRCKRFRFRSLSVPEIAQQLTKVAQQEGIRATPGALAMLSNAADGSLRDGLSLLDQAATLAAGGEINEAECMEILALVDSEQLEALYSAIASGDRGAVIATLNRLLESGEDPRHVGRELVRLLRRLLMLSAGAKGDMTEAEHKRLDPLARAMPYENLLRGVSLCVQSPELAPRADDSPLVVQMLGLKLAELPRLKKIEDVLSSVAAKPLSTSLPEPRRADSRGPRIVSIGPVEPEGASAPEPVL